MAYPVPTPRHEIQFLASYDAKYGGENVLLEVLVFLFLPCLKVKQNGVSKAIQKNSGEEALKFL